MVSGTIKHNAMLCCGVIDAGTISNKMQLKQKFVLNVMLEHRVDL